MYNVGESVYHSRLHPDQPDSPSLRHTTGPPTHSSHHHTVTRAHTTRKLGGTEEEHECDCTTCACVCVCVCVSMLQYIEEQGFILTVISQEDSSDQQKEQQRDDSSHSELHTPLFQSWEHTTHTGTGNTSTPCLPYLLNVYNIEIKCLVFFLPLTLLLCNEKETAVPLWLGVERLISGGGFGVRWWTYWGFTSDLLGGGSSQSTSSWVKHGAESRYCQWKWLWQ